MVDIKKKENKTFEVIAEIGWNFMGDLSLARKMIQAAKSSGADYVKFQYWNENKLKPGAWDVDGRREIYKNAQLDKNKILNLIRLCNESEVEFLISCFNTGDAKFLKDIGIERIKIPSHEINNTNLHNYASNNFKKCFVSLGAGSSEEVLNAIKIYNSSSVDWVGMHCVSSYPCPIEMINLPKLKYLKKFVDNLGLSDHTSETITPSLAYILGARVIEKHFTTDNTLPGRDNRFALIPKKFKEMVSLLEKTSKSIIDLGSESSELEKDTIENYRGRWGD